MSTASRPRCTAVAARLAVAAGLALAIGPFAPRAEAQTPGVSPARATVFIRTIGDLDLTRPPDQPGGERHVQETNVELSTGSGVLVSSGGHVLTAAHVVTGDQGTVTLNGIRIEVKQTIRKIEVLLPGDDASPGPPTPWEGVILAKDDSLDLAVLSVNGNGLPFLDLGDSDALAVGDPVEAVGFPFGEEVEIGRPRPPLPVAPAPSVSRGNLAAFREDVQGERRYVQVTAPLNAGNSGGPIVDGDGYLVAIASSVIRQRGGGATGVGFGVSVNIAKRFLEAHGLDVVLRAHRVTPGPPSSLDGKGLRVPLLIGMADASPLRSRVDAASQSGDGVVLRIDRVVSPWPAARVAEALTSGRAFEPFAATSSVPPRPVEVAGGRLVLGRATGTMDDGTLARIEYGVLEAGVEKLVARFIGPPHQLAYNASVVRGALRRIEADVTRAPGRALAGPLDWRARPPRGTPVDRVPLPAGWVLEAAGPLACRDLPPPSEVAGASPPADFAVALRAGWIAVPGVAARQAAAACGDPAGADGSEYTRTFTFLGTRYQVGGRFISLGGAGLLQLESLSPSDQAPAVGAIFAEWVRKQLAPPS